MQNMEIYVALLKEKQNYHKSVVAISEDFKNFIFLYIL